MRATLEQLKAMSNDQLMSHWFRGEFPFDGATDCGNCLTMHGRDWSANCHKELTAVMRPLRGDGESARPCVTKYLEELYALRLFYDYLYPQQEIPEAVATQEVSVEVVK